MRIQRGIQRPVVKKAPSVLLQQWRLCLLSSRKWRRRGAAVHRGDQALSEPQALLPRPAEGFSLRQAADPSSFTQTGGWMFKVSGEAG